MRQGRQKRGVRCVSAAAAAVLCLGAIAGCEPYPGVPDPGLPPLVGTYLTTDFAVPAIDADDYYDVAVAIAMDFDGIVLDEPTPEAEAAIRELGGNPVPVGAMVNAQTIVTVGAATHAAQVWRPGMRVVMFAGDAEHGEHDANDYNVRLDPVSYLYLRPRARWVPCDQGGLWQAGPNASFTHTMDDIVLDGLDVTWWFEKYLELGHRNLWGGALLQFAAGDEWRGHSVASGWFVKGPDFDEDMVDGLRELLAGLPGDPDVPDQPDEPDEPDEPGEPGEPAA